MKNMKKRLDFLLFKILISIVLIAIPGGVYYLYGFQVGAMTAFCEIIFLVLATREDVIDMKENSKP